MRSVLVGAVLVLALLLGAWWLRREPPRVAVTTAPPPARVAADVRPADDVRPSADEPPRARRLREGAAAREAMHRKITEAIATRPAPARTAAAEPPTPVKTATATAPDAAPALLDRTGNHPYLARVLGQDLIPLVDECHELARAGNPDLAGMLVFDVEILGDEDIGGVIDSLEPGETNEVTDPAMLECVRESLLSTTLPPPTQGGRDAISLSLRLDPPA